MTGTAVAQGTVAMGPRAGGFGSNHANDAPPDLPTEPRTTDVEAWRQSIDERREARRRTRSLNQAAAAATSVANVVPVAETPPLPDVALSPRRPSPPAVRAEDVDPKVAQRLAWVTAYLAGDGLAAIATRAGVAPETVRRHLRNVGVQMRARGPHAPERAPSAPPASPSAPAPLSTPAPAEPELEPEPAPAVAPAAAAPQKPEAATVEFAWEDPDDVYGTRWFPRPYRDLLDTEPGRWGRIAAGAGNHVHVELRKRFPDYEFAGRRDSEHARTYTVYARRKTTHDHTGV